MSHLKKLDKRVADDMSDRGSVIDEIISMSGISKNATRAHLIKKNLNINKFQKDLPGATNRERKMIQKQKANLPSDMNGEYVYGMDKKNV